ncbi:hypothetical protein NEAUS03_0670 [Nematocida ausubeli]|nr:hypothetical protein NEAUS03_0670 [Nematocida ausubeli]
MNIPLEFSYDYMGFENKIIAVEKSSLIQHWRLRIKSNTILQR